MEMLKKTGMLMTLVAALGMGAFAMTGCEQESATENAAEDAADRMDEAADNLGDNLDQAGENVQDAADNAQDNLEDTADDMTN